MISGFFCTSESGAGSMTGQTTIKDLPNTPFAWPNHITATVVLHVGTEECQQKYIQKPRDVK